MSKVCVTGGSGFLGSHLSDALCAAGHEVVIFDYKPSKFLRNNQTEIIGDILKPNEVESAIEGCEYVYHLAGFADLNAARTRPYDAAMLNILGTINVLEAARKHDIKRVIYASTVYVFSKTGGFYRCSKQAAESFVEEYYRRYGLEYTVLRYGSLYGPRADDTNGVYRVLRDAVVYGRIRNFGRPDDQREYIHVEDASRISAEALSDSYRNEHLVITGHHPTLKKDLFTMISEILGKKLAVEYIAPGDFEGHYSITPYNFVPRIGKKVTTPIYMDIGQGLLQIVEEIYRESNKTNEGARKG